jgi:hypothetical protein
MIARAKIGMSWSERLRSVSETTALSVHKLTSPSLSADKKRHGESNGKGGHDSDDSDRPKKKAPPAKGKAPPPKAKGKAPPPKAKGKR